MAVKAMNFKMEEADILDMKQVAGVFNMSVTDLIKNAIKEYLAELKMDPFYRLTTNVQEATVEESKEILSEIEDLTDDDISVFNGRTATIIINDSVNDQSKQDKSAFFDAIGKIDIDKDAVDELRRASMI